MGNYANKDYVDNIKRLLFKDAAYTTKAGILAVGEQTSSRLPPQLFVGT